MANLHVENERTYTEMFKKTKSCKMKSNPIDPTFTKGSITNLQLPAIRVRPTAVIKTTSRSVNISFPVKALIKDSVEQILLCISSVRLHRGKYVMKQHVTVFRDPS